MVGKVELISTFATVVCECWNVIDKYTWDDAGDLNNSPWTTFAVRVTGAIKKQFSHGKKCFDNNSLSQETCNQPLEN